MVRISIAGMVGLVVAFALGIAALVNATDLWVGASLSLTLAALLGSVLCLILRGWRGGGAVGFAMFGWAHFLLGLAPAGLSDHMRELSDPPARWAFDRSNVEPAPGSNRLPSPASAEQLASHRAFQDHRHRRANAGLIGHWLAVLTFAMLGSILGVSLTRGRPTGPSPPPHG